MFFKMGFFFLLWSPNISPYLIAARLQKTPLASTSNRQQAWKILKILVEYSLKYLTHKMAQNDPKNFLEDFF